MDDKKPLRYLELSSAQRDFQKQVIEADPEQAKRIRNNFLHRYPLIKETLNNMNIHDSIKVLDHGYVKLIDFHGTDAAIIEAARMSTNKGFLGWGPREVYRCEVCKKPGGECQDDSHEDSTERVVVPGDEELLRYLWENKHATPFEMAGLTIEVAAPIFVVRQWHRHRTQSYNEMSGRYTPLPNVNYLPAVERLMAGKSKNKQAGTVKDAGELTEAGAELMRGLLQASYERAEVDYQRLLASGVPKELARLHLPVARYTRMRASANLRNWLGFLTLRMDSHAQYEIRVYADAIGKLVCELFPKTWELFLEGMKK